MVNTFLPYADFRKVAQILDYKRLGKQRVEAQQILDVGIKNHGAWSNHPVVLMWKPYPDCLKVYINVMIEEWIRRGYKNTMKKHDVPKKYKRPWWLGWQPLHKSHQANLLQKSDYYKKYFKVPPSYLKYSYIWISDLSEEKIKKIKENPNAFRIQSLAKLSTR